MLLCILNQTRDIIRLTIKSLQFFCFVLIFFIVVLFCFCFFIFFYIFCPWRARIIWPRRYQLSSIVALSVESLSIDFKFMHCPLKGLSWGLVWAVEDWVEGFLNGGDGRASDFYDSCLLPFLHFINWCLQKNVKN